jgi:methyl-accepting chemotaxis protein
VLLLVVLLIIGLVGAVGYVRVNNTLEESTQETLETSAAQQSDAMSEWANARQFEAQLIAENEAITSEDSDVVQEAIESEESSLDRSAVHVINPQEGEIIASTSLDSPLLERYDYPWTEGGFLDEFEDGLWVSNTAYDSTADFADTRVIGFGAQVEGSDRIVILDASLDVRSQILNRGEERTSFLSTSGEPVLLADEDSADGFDQSVIDELASEGGSAFVSGDPVRAYQRVSVGTNEWIAVTSVPESEAFAVQDTVALNVLFIVISALVALGLLGLVIGRQTLAPLADLRSKANRMEEGDLDVDMSTHRIDEFGDLYGAFDSMRESLKDRITETESARKEAEVARAEAEEMAEHLQDKAEQYSEIMDNVGEGDLTQRMTTDGEEESMDRIAAEFNDMIEELEKTTGQLKSYVDEVEEAGSEVEQSALTVRQASEQVADSIQKISDDAYDQKERLQTVSESVDEIAASLDAFAQTHDVDIDEELENIEELSAQIEEIAELSEETMAESENVAGAAEEQAAELNEVSERANDLQNYAQPLRDILDRFETEAEHEFVFSVGPTGSNPQSRGADE